jgi:hypothetical protein
MELLFQNWKSVFAHVVPIGVIGTAKLKPDQIQTVRVKVRDLYYKRVDQLVKRGQQSVRLVYVLDNMN